jgi:hypothetical protein
VANPVPSLSLTKSNEGKGILVGANLVACLNYPASDL